MRIVFVGTSEFAVPALQALADARADVAGILTQPDRPRGRGLHPAPSAVKRLATRLGRPLFQPDSINSPESLAWLGEAAPELIVVASYGQLLKAGVLGLPRHGCVNLHASLLPRHRGAAPVARAILAGDAKTGVTIFRMVEALDAGAILAQAECPVPAGATAGSLEKTLAELVARLLVELLPRLEGAGVTPQAQDDAAATLAPKLRRSEGRIDWSQSAAALERRIRGLQPWPRAHAWFERAPGKRVRIVLLGAQARGYGGAAGAPEAGTVESASAEGIDVRTGSGILRLLQLQPENKRVMTAGDFVNGYGVRAGTTRFVQRPGRGPLPKPG